MGKIKITWMTDSSSRQSCHINASGLSAKESYLGHIARDGKKWYVILKDESKNGPYTSMHRAFCALIELVNGEPV